MYYGVSWHDEDYELLEWDIIAEKRIFDDERLGEGLEDVLCDLDRDLYVDIDEYELRGSDTVPGAVWVNIAGPFASEMAAQYYIDEEVAEDDDY